MRYRALIYTEQCRRGRTLGDEFEARDYRHAECVVCSRYHTEINAANFLRLEIVRV